MRMTLAIQYYRNVKEAHVAQSVEHLLGKEEVTGSSPVMSSINNNKKHRWNENHSRRNNGKS